MYVCINTNAHTYTLLIDTPKYTQIYIDILQNTLITLILRQFFICLIKEKKYSRKREFY